MDEPNLQTVPHERSVDLAATQQPAHGGEQARSSHLVAPRWVPCWPILLAATGGGRQSHWGWQAGQSQGPRWNPCIAQQQLDSLDKQADINLLVPCRLASCQHSALINRTRSLSSIPQADGFPLNVSMTAAPRVTHPPAPRPAKSAACPRTPDPSPYPSGR